MDKEILQPPRGMRDIVGKEAELHEYLKKKFQEIALLHGFKPIITPTIEFFKLFEEKSGEEIKKSMYVFKDKANRTIALRPEVTASVVRAYLRLLQSSPKPLYLYYVAQCFRYEEPQRGRYREFWQGGLEIFGDKSINADIAAAITASRYLDEIGVNHYYIVGNVALYRRIMDSFNIPQETQDHILHLIDKEQIDNAIDELGRINEKASEIIDELINTPLENLEEFIGKYKNILEKYTDQLLSEIEKTREFINTMNKLGYKAIYKPTLVRGLAYYTGLIYEYKAEELTISIGGGGRYDGLTKIYGGPYEYSTGLALGIDRIALILSHKPRMLKLTNKEAIIILLNVPLLIGYNIQKRLIDIGVTAAVMKTNKIKKALSLANKKNYDYAIIIGEKEYAQSMITIKNLLSGKQYQVPMNILEKTIVEDILREE